MSQELSLWALFFIVFIGTVWITLRQEIREVKRLLEDKEGKNDRPNGKRGVTNPPVRDV